MRQLLAVPAPDGGRVLQRELVQGGVPGEMRAVVRLRCPAIDPVVQPAQASAVVTGLVVHVSAGVHGMTGGRLGRQRPGGQRGRLGPPLLLLPDEREHPGVPPVVAVRGRQRLHQRPRLLPDVGDAGECDRRHGGSQHQRIPRVRPQVCRNRGALTPDMGGHRGYLAPFPLGAVPLDRGGRRRQRSADVHAGRTVFVAQQGQPGMRQTESGIGPDGRAQVVLGPGLHHQDPPQPGVVRLRGLLRRRQPKSV
jgi:hypothetical protein